MKAIELLEKYPLSTEVVREWFMRKMIESIKGDSDVPEDFKNFMLEQGIENDKLCILIDSNSRGLFDVFDENEIYIHIEPFCDELEKELQSFGYRILFNDYIPKNMEFKNRKEAELFAVEAAFEILENKLTPKEKSNENN